MNKIICYGDSNTYGWDPADAWGTPYAEPWPEILGEKLGCQVIGMGEPERCIPVSCGVDSFTAMLGKYDPVDLIIIMLGTNDILNMLGSGISRATDRMDQLLYVLKPRRILLMGLPQIEVGNPMIDEAVPKMNLEFSQLAQKHEIEFLDAAKTVIDLSYDGVHFTEGGHLQLAEYVADYLKNRAE